MCNEWIRGPSSVAIGHALVLYGTINVRQLSDAMGHMFLIPFCEVASLSPASTPRQHEHASRELQSVVSEALKIAAESPWSLPHCLAELFAGDIVPWGSYRRLRLLLLMCMVEALAALQEDTSKETIRSSISFLLGCDIGDPAPHRLLLYARHILGVASGTSGSLEASAGGGATSPFPTTRFDSAWKCHFVEGGLAATSPHGICVVPNVDSLKTGEKERLAELLDEGAVHCTIPQQEADISHVWINKPAPMKVAVRCGFWMLSERPMPVPVFQPSLGWGKKTTESAGGLPRKLVSRVDIVLDCSFRASGAETVRHDKGFAEQYLCARLCNVSVEQQRSLFPSIDCDELVSVLRSAASLSVTIGSRARDMVQRYYVASRRVRMSGVHATEVPLSCLETLSKLAMAHARLSMRAVAEIEDVTVAIVMYEESLATLYGSSMLSIRPSPHYGDCADAYGGNTHGERMSRLTTHIMRFCDACAPTPFA
eukprot:Opistho-2@94771